MWIIIMQPFSYDCHTKAVVKSMCDTYKDAGGSKCQRLEDIGSTPYTTVQEHRNSSLCSLDNLTISLMQKWNIIPLLECDHFLIYLAYASVINMLKYLFQRHNSGRHVIKLASAVIRHYNSCCSSLNWKPCCKTMQKEKKRKCSSICKNYKMTVDIATICIVLTILGSEHTLHQNWQSGDCLKPLHILYKYSKQTYKYKYISGATHLYKELVHNHAIYIVGYNSQILKKV